jgi:hypothetical protein
MKRTIKFLKIALLLAAISAAAERTMRLSNKLLRNLSNHA